MEEMTIQGGSYANVIRGHGKATSVGSDLQVRVYRGGEVMLTLQPGTQYECGIMLSRGDVQRFLTFVQKVYR